MHIGLGWRALNALALCLCLGVALLAPATLVAGPLELHKLVGAREALSEPFGLYTVPMGRGGLRDKWVGVQRKLREEEVVLASCREDRAHCASPAAAELLAIADAGREREGLARIGEINRAINLSIRFVSDAVNYGEADVWSSPLATLEKGSGDCEDYAIAKMVALKEAGIPPEDLRLLILRDMAHADDHAVLAVRLEGRWLLLDNRMLVMLPASELANYRPIFVADDEGVRAYRDLPAPQRALDLQGVAYLISAQAGAAL
jgi:predicted transglutaminase-like cysteine proteinase